MGASAWLAGGVLANRKTTQHGWVPQNKSIPRASSGPVPLCVCVCVCLGSPFHAASKCKGEIASTPEIPLGGVAEIRDISRGARSRSEPSGSRAGSDATELQKRREPWAGLARKNIPWHRCPI